MSESFVLVQTRDAVSLEPLDANVYTIPERIGLVYPRLLFSTLENPKDPMAFEGRAIVFDGPEDYHARIDDPAIADKLIPSDHPIGAKRICTDTNYFQTFNLPHVKLVSVKETPIEQIDATGITKPEQFEVRDDMTLAVNMPSANSMTLDIMAISNNATLQSGLPGIVTLANAFTVAASGGTLGPHLEPGRHSVLKDL